MKKMILPWRLVPVLLLGALFLQNGCKVEEDDETDATEVYVYFAGYTTNSGGYEVPCYWKNGGRLDLSVLVAGKWGWGYSIFISGSDIHVSGATRNSSEVEVPSYWKNDVRSDLSMADATKNGDAKSVFVVKN